MKYNWTGDGTPGGCDSHCIPHPCGPCITGKSKPEMLFGVDKDEYALWKSTAESSPLDIEKAIEATRRILNQETRK